MTLSEEVKQRITDDYESFKEKMYGKLTDKECLNYYDYTKTNFFKYLYVNERVDVHTHPEFLPFMPTYTHPWTSNDLYKFFGLTEDEIKEIEQEIK